MSVIWLEQKVYELSAMDGSKTMFPNGDNLLVVVNDVKTEVPIANLFLGGKCTFYNDEAMIKGHSILYKLDKAETNISLVDKESGYAFKISKVRNPAIQSNDKEISDIEFAKAIEDIKSLSQAREEQPETEVKEEGMTSETEVPVAEPMVWTEEFSQNDNYDKEIAQLKTQGYTEERDGNFAVIRKGDEKPIIVRITPLQYFTVKDNKLEDGTTVNLVDGKLVVVFPSYSMALNEEIKEETK